QAPTSSTPQPRMQRVLSADELRTNRLVQTNRREIENLRLHLRYRAAAMNPDRRRAQEPRIRARLVTPARAKAAAANPRAADGRPRFDLPVARPPVQLAAPVLGHQHDVGPLAVARLLRPLDVELVAPCAWQMRVEVIPSAKPAIRVPRDVENLIA